MSSSSSGFFFIFALRITVASQQKCPRHLASLPFDRTATVTTSLVDSYYGVRTAPFVHNLPNSFPSCKSIRPRCSQAITAILHECGYTHRKNRSYCRSTHQQNGGPHTILLLQPLVEEHVERRPRPGHAGRAARLGRLVPPGVARLSRPAGGALRLELGAEHCLDGVQQRLRDRDDKGVGQSTVTKRIKGQNLCSSTADMGLDSFDYKAGPGRWGGAPTSFAE
jgi:hypothetical protein